MKAAVVKGNSKVEIEDFDISDIDPNELWLKMQSCMVMVSLEKNGISLKNLMLIINTIYLLILFLDHI